MAFPIFAGSVPINRFQACMVALAALALYFFLALAAPAQARDPRQEGMPPRGGANHPAMHPEHAAPRGGPVVIRQLPRGNVTVRMGRDEYYYHHGHYFRRGGIGFVAILPPVGLVVPLLPPGYTTVVVAGSPFYYYEGVYYTQRPDGFVVVAPPPTVVLPPASPAPAPSYGTISVTAISLNVRSGPGRGYNVITVIQRGDICPVQATAPGWLYIQLPDGRFGWVEQSYTTPAATVPSG